MIDALQLGQLVIGVGVGLTYAVVAIGFTLIYRVLSAVNFAHGEVYTFGAFATLIGAATLGLSHWLIAPLVVAVGAAAGWLIERLAFRPFRRSNDEAYLKSRAVREATLLSSMALGIVSREALDQVFHGQWMAIPQAWMLNTPVMIGPLLIIPQNVVVVSVGLVAMIGFHLFMTRTRLGTAMRATAQNIRGATLVGINPRHCVSISWGLGAVMAGIAGVMIAFTYNISVDMGAASGLKGFTAAILGGFGNLPASMAGGVVLGVVENGAAEIFSHEYKDVVAFVVIVLILLFKPAGLFARSGGARRI